MPVKIRAATPADLPLMVELLMQDAQRRCSHDSALWALADDARKRIADAVIFALTAETQPFRQRWLVAQSEGGLVGIVHSVHLPVPPIYAGELGDPGLLMPETFVAPDAPKDTLDALLEAAEADLRGSGARILLASFVCGRECHTAFRRRSYEPLTLYLSKSGLEDASHPQNARAATDLDIDGIVASSAENRSVLEKLDIFWKPHPEADVLFGSWMMKSLTLADRDMLVVGPTNQLDGYIVAQPASRLHFPPAHDISATGVIDDYFHSQLADPVALQEGDGGGEDLLRAAEASFAARGITSAFVVCPAAWASKIRFLESAGYRTAMVWMIKR